MQLVIQLEASKGGMQVGRIKEPIKHPYLGLPHQRSSHLSRPLTPCDPNLCSHGTILRHAVSRHVVVDVVQGPHGTVGAVLHLHDCQKKQFRVPWIIVQISWLG